MQDQVLTSEDAARTGAGASDWLPGVAEASRRIAEGSLRPSDLVDAVLARIDAVDGAIRSYVHVDRSGATATAAVADAEIAAGQRRGPLHGIPFAVKDNYDAAGLPCVAGSEALTGRVAERDAALVAQLRAVGAILVGKLSTWEYGTGNGGEYFDLAFPPARNPWDLARFPGGSSTGAGSAVAAGTALFALGSDTTGSVRLPAAATGTIGFMATQGTLSRDGILPNCHSLDMPGPIAWTVEDCALVLNSLRCPATPLGPKDDAGRSIRGRRVAVVRDPGPGMPPPDPELRYALEAGADVLRGLGAVVEEVSLPIPAAECLALTQMIGPAESAAIHEEELRTRPATLGRALREKLLAGSAVRAVDYITALRRRGEVAAAMGEMMAPFDALVTYGALHLPPRLGIEPEMTAFTLDTMMTPFNLAGMPAMVQCTGFTDAGLPTHWQIAGRRRGEAAMLAVAAAYESVTPWRTRRPSIEARPPPPPDLVGNAPDREPGAAVRARADRVGLGALSDADLARWEEITEGVERRGGVLTRPCGKEVAPVFTIGDDGLATRTRQRSDDMSDSRERNYAGVFDTRLGFGESPAVLVIDFVYGYTTPESPLYAEGVVRAVDESVDLLAAAREAGVPVIYTKVVYHPSGMDGGLFVKKVPVLRRLVPGERLAEIDDKVAPRDEDLVIVKNYPSAFFGTSLAATLTAMRIDTMVLLGCSTSGCVRATAIDSLQHGFRTIVPRECVGDRHDGPHDANLFDMNAKYADVLPKAEVVEYLAARSDPARRRQGSEPAERQSLTA